MTHFGLTCPASAGHLHTMLPLGQELLRRGHRVTFFGFLDARSRTEAAGLEFRPIGESEFPLGAMEEQITRIGEKSGLAALQQTLHWINKATIVRLEQAPAVLREAGIETLVVDQVSSGSKTIVDLLEIPFVSVCSALPLNRDPSVPPMNTHWSYSPTWWAQWRNWVGYALLNYLGRSVRQTIAEYRRAWNLPTHSHPNQAYSPLAQISQEPAEFEFRRQQLPPCFHFTGPYHNLASRTSVTFPYEHLSGKPLIYASMGTVQNRQQEIFYCIAQACAEWDADVVISLGGSCRPEDLPELPGSPIVVEYAPQLELLEKATLTITHAGLNTTLESLTQGVPMVAIPIANDQPGVGARIAWTGTGEVVPLKRLNASRLRKVVQQVLTNPDYKRNAFSLQKAIYQAGGATQAAEIIEQVAQTVEPVLAESSR